jgi:UDP-N-acetyl-2-amino-2-deoxyglucuronate dehydrogenase
MKYGFGIIGLGLISHTHAKAIKELKNASLVACYSRSKKKADDFAENYKCKGYNSIDEFLLNPNIDIVTICTPSGFHLEPAIRTAKAKKHLMIEKPLEITLDRCDKIIEACRKNNVKLAVVFQSRFYEASSIIKKAIENNKFGKLVNGDAYIKWLRTQKYYDEGGWHGTLKYDGGGALMNQSIHAIDLLQWFMGPVESLQAYIDTIGHKRIEVEDNAVAALKFKNGALGVIVGSTSIYPGFQKRIEISGIKGSAVLEENTIKVWDFKDKTKEDEVLLKRFNKLNVKVGGAADPSTIDHQGHKNQFIDFINAIETNKSPLIDGIEGRKSVEIILSIYKSAKKGKKILV